MGMTKATRSAALVISAVCATSTVVPAAAQTEPPGVLVAVRTSLGAFEVLVDTARAPITAANFLRYVDAGAYTDGYFHRTVRSDN